MSDDSSKHAMIEALEADALLIDRILNPIRQVLRLTGLILLGIMIVTPFVQVVMRQFFSVPLIGADELTRFMLISVVMLTIPYTISSGSSVRMEEFQHVLPALLRRALTVLIALCGVAAFAFASWSVFTATISNLNNATPTLGIPYYVFFSATAVGFFGAALEYIVIAAKAIIGTPIYVTFAAEQPPEELTL